MKSKPRPEESEQPLPAEIEAERLVLGSILLGSVPYIHVAAMLEVADFAIEFHQTLVRRMGAIDRRGDTLNAPTLIRELTKHKDLNRAGGISYLADLTKGVPELRNVDTHIRAIQEAATRRRGISAANELVKRLYDPREDPDSIAGHLARLTQALNGNNQEPAPSSIPQWPDPLRPEAFHGIAGELVRLIEPVSEADPAALLIQILIGWGSLVGRGAYYLAEADRHHTNEYAVLVGVTSKARKGTSWGRIRVILSAIDDHWVENRFLGGIGSGEALIDMVAGDDHRALILESEFARLLAVVNREGSTISSNVRNGWDNGILSVETRQKKQRVNGAHISVIGHITRDELLHRLSAVEAANGFANRHLFVCAKRTKLLPFGGGLTGDVAGIIRKVKDATDKARKLGNTRVDFNEEAKQLWAHIYAVLSEGKPGLLGAITSRAEAHVVRLALIYSLLDKAEEIRLEHLKAALAVWDYSEASAAYIWGDRLGDPTADEILDALKATVDGLNRRDLHQHFSGHKTGTELDRALGVLTERGLIRSAAEESGGRPGTRFWVS